MKLVIAFLMIVSLLNASKVELEVLGSCGPELDGRASTSYLVWIDDKARIIIDMGSGSMLYFEKSHAKIEDLDLVILTHLHIDHSVDLPAFVKAGYFSHRSKPLEIMAPSGNEQFPSGSQFLENLFGEKGAYRYMSDVLTKKSDSFELIPIDVKDIAIDSYKEFKISAIRVHHGVVPSLAVRIDVGEKSIVISGDTTNKNHDLELLSMNADLFVAHHAVSQDAQGYARELHMKPSMIATIAQKADVKKLLLTHRMKRTIGKEKETQAEIAKRYKGEIVFAEDRMKLKI